MFSACTLPPPIHPASLHLCRETRSTAILSLDRKFLPLQSAASGNVHMKDHLKPLPPPHAHRCTRRLPLSTRPKPRELPLSSPDFPATLQQPHSLGRSSHTHD